MPPLVVTLLVADEAQRVLDELRRRHFPPERLHVGAHVTLFHALPDEPRVTDVLSQVAAREPFEVAVTGVRLLGRGVAYDLSSPDLVVVHSHVAAAFAGRLTRQDAQPFRPHVTVQNKVSPEAARALHTALAAEFVPWSTTAVGLGLWRYVGGPWEPVASFPFASRQA